LTEYFAGFALIVSYLYDPDRIFQENVARCSKAQFIAGPHRPDETLDEHATAVFLKPLERLAIFDADPVPLLSLNVQPSMLNQLALHPGSGSEKKNWPEQNWRQFLEHMAEAADLKLLLVGGEAEGDRLQRLAVALPRERIQLARNLSLAELAGRLKRCLGFIGHDSGISHLAAAVGLPTLVLWGDTKQSIWRPRGDHVTVIASPMGLSGIGVETVVGEAVRRFHG
jgi:heptosyltransferase-2